jgi:hypothetical protein
MTCKTYGVNDIVAAGEWTVELADEFEPEFDALPEGSMRRAAYGA